jgi:hypothetical protein
LGVTAGRSSDAELKIIERHLSNNAAQRASPNSLKLPELFEY